MVSMLVSMLVLLDLSAFETAELLLLLVGGQGLGSCEAHHLRLVVWRKTKTDQG